MSLLAPVAPFPEPQGRAVSGHTKYETRCFDRATSTSAANVVTDHHGRESLKKPSFGRESLDMPDFGLVSLDMPNFCPESLDKSLGPRPRQLKDLTLLSWSQVALRNLYFSVFLKCMVAVKTKLAPLYWLKHLAILC